METVWIFKTARFTVALQIEEESGYQYDGDDEDGETQAMIDSGEMVAFMSRVVVKLDGRTIGQDTLGGSVYYANDIADFWTAHRDPNPANRNCAANAYRVGHYFPGMVSEAIREARATLCDVPRLRCAA